MSFCKQEGKDKIIFASKEDHEKESSVSLSEPDEPVGLIKPNGEINWSCPCLGGMATGPCGVDFREAFSCFHYSEAEPKGSDCYEAFKVMQECMLQYPAVYKAGAAADDDEDEEKRLHDNEAVSFQTLDSSTAKTENTSVSLNETKS